MVVALLILYCSELTHSVQRRPDQQWQNLPCRTEPGDVIFPRMVEMAMCHYLWQLLTGPVRKVSAVWLRGCLQFWCLGFDMCTRFFCVCTHLWVVNYCAAQPKDIVAPSQHPWELLAGNTTSINNQGDLQFPTSPNRKMVQFLTIFNFFFFLRKGGGACDPFWSQ